MNRRSLLKSPLAWLGAVAAVGVTARPAEAYYYFFRYHYSYHAHRNRRRLRWRLRRGF